ncbi:MAG: hypothetical protein K2N51_10100 [Lachnospiraceae bacterium]|nr:hypothetical protein [Lachnospiraceae bacterium]
MTGRKHRIKIIGMVLAAILLIGGIGYRLYWINACYPSPQVKTYSFNESIEAGNYRITFSDWQWGDGTNIYKMYPEYVYLTDEKGNAYPASKMRVGILELTVTKTADDESIVALENIAFESGAWGNQFDLELAYLMNPDLEGLRIKMKADESRKILLPMIMNDTHFTDEQWRNIDQRKFYIVLQYYPEKIRFECPVTI